MTPMPTDQTPATSGALFEVYQMLSDKIDEKHASMRDTVERLGARVEGNFRELQQAHQNIANRVLTIETERKAEAGEQERETARLVHETDLRVGFFSLAVSSVVSVVLWLVAKIWK